MIWSVRHVSAGLAPAKSRRSSSVGQPSGSAWSASLNRRRALPLYEEFLSLWKDADDDVPLYKEAKAEYRRLRSP